MTKYSYENHNSNPTLLLKKKNQRIKNNRLSSVPDDSKSIYLREIEDLEIFIRKLKKEQENMAKHPPSDDQTSKIALDFDSGAYVSKEIELGVKIRNLETKLEIAKKRFQFIIEDDY